MCSKIKRIIIPVRFPASWFMPSHLNRLKTLIPPAKAATIFFLVAVSFLLCQSPVNFEEQRSRMFAIELDLCSLPSFHFFINLEWEIHYTVYNKYKLHIVLSFCPNLSPEYSWQGVSPHLIPLLGIIKNLTPHNSSIIIIHNLRLETTTKYWQNLHRIGIQVTLSTDTLSILFLRLPCPFLGTEML